MRRICTFAFMFLCTATGLAQQPAAQASLTAQQVIDRIEADFGTTFPPETVDTYKAGDGATRVTGIVTTFLPTMDVLRAAVAQGKNLILTHEPTFYNHRDSTELFNADPVYREKLAYIHDHGLVIFRLHDTIHMAKPDRIVDAFIGQAGWRNYAEAGSLEYFTLPSTTVAALAADLATKLNAHAVRVVGDPSVHVSHIALRVGAPGEKPQIVALQHPGVQVLVTGEASEWETVEYVRDASLQGRPMALILLGHNASEEIGMKPFAARVQQLFPQLPVSFIAAGEPYWPAEHPQPLHQTQAHSAGSSPVIPADSRAYGPR